MRRAQEKRKKRYVPQMNTNCGLTTQMSSVSEIYAKLHVKISIRSD